MEHLRLKDELESFFNKPLKVLIKEQKKFSLLDVGEFPGLSPNARAYFNLIKSGITENDVYFKEDLKDEIVYLEGSFFPIPSSSDFFSEA